MKLNQLSDQARELLNMPAEWEAYRVQVLSFNIIKITGAVPSFYIRGEKKGKKNWRKINPETKRIIQIPQESHEKWLLEWEQKTGKCHECEGTSEVFVSWSVREGRKNKPCRRCNGTGNAPK